MDNPPEHLVSLTSVPTDMEASIILATLETEGIKAVATGGFTAGFKAEAPGRVDVMVAEADLPLAKNTLAKLKQENQDIDWSQVDVGEADDA